MHFGNGRPAQNGDPVVCRGYDGKITAGTIFGLQGESAGTCNVSVAVMRPGGTDVLTCQDVNKMYHAEDAFAAADTKPEAPAPAPSPDAPGVQAEPAGEQQPAAPEPPAPAPAAN